MPFRGPPPVDPQVPSTSTSVSRRIEDNRRRFEDFCPVLDKESSGVVTLWDICKSRVVNKPKKIQLLMVQSLRGLSFETLLLNYKDEISEIAIRSHTTFKELCVSLRFFAYYRKMPLFKSDSHDAKYFFQLVCNCIKFSEEGWIADMNKDNLLETKSMEALKIKRTVRTEQNIDFESATISNVGDESIPVVNQKSTSNSVTRLQDREKVPLPPPPTLISPSKKWRTEDDENLKAMHNLPVFDTRFRNNFEKAVKIIEKNNASVRTKSENLTDIEYYGDDEILLNTQFSLRIESVLQLPKFELPKIENDGYFGPDCDGFEWYLYRKYIEANEICTDVFDKIRNSKTPKPGFILDQIHPHELYKFHMAGRHIHGFFIAWKELERGWQQSDGKWVQRRYLVDIYNYIMFPLYVDFQYWPTQLQWAFDKYSLYALRLLPFIKLHAADLEKAGKDNFTPYASRQRTNSSTTKNRINVQEIEAANESLNNTIIKENRSHVLGTPSKTPRKRKANPAKEEVYFQLPGYPNTPQIDRSPQLKIPLQKEVESPKYVSRPTIIQKQPVQKENMDKAHMTPARPPTTVLPPAPIVKLTPPLPRAIPANTAMLPKPIPTVQQRVTPIALKRRLPEHEKLFTPNIPPSKKKLSISHDSWVGHLHFGADEEHVDESKDSDNPDDESEDRRAVWVPQEQGLEPEQYAKMILSHYPDETRQNQKTPSTSLAVGRRRKSVNKNSPDTASITVAPLVGDDLPSTIPYTLVGTPRAQPNSTLTTNSTSPPVPTNPNPATTSQVSVTPASGTVAGSSSNGSHLPLPTGKAITKRARIQYSSKPPILPTGSRHVYPVKQLVTSTTSPVVLNGATSVGIATQRAPVTSSMLPRTTYQRTPYYPTGMRPKPMFGVQNQSKGPTSLTNGLTPSAKSADSRNPVQHLMQRDGPRPPGGSSSELKDQPDPPEELLETPASRAAALLISNENIGCQRSIPFDKQMQLLTLHRQHQQLVAGKKETGLDAREIVTKRKTGLVPPRSQPSTSTVPVVQRATSSQTKEPQSVPYRPRSFSNTTKQPKKVPPIAAPTVAPSSASPSNANERTVGVANYRQEMPPVPNNRQSIEQLRTQTGQKTAERTQLPSTSSTSELPRKPSPVTDLKLATMKMDKMINYSQSITMKTNSPQIRKPHGMMTPEQLGHAVRYESERVKSDGRDGLSVKDFLLGMQQKNDSPA